MTSPSPAIALDAYLPADAASRGGFGRWLAGRKAWLASERGPVHLFAILWAAMVLVPVATSVILSLVRTRGVRILWTPSLQAYRDIVETGRWEVLVRTATAAAVMTAICLVIGFPFALWLAKRAKSEKLVQFVWMALTVPFFLDPSARTLVWRGVLGSTGLINTALLKLHLIDSPIQWLLFSDFSVYLGLVGPYFPNMVMPVYLAVLLIDNDLIQASADLGATPAQTLRNVIVPLAMPGIVAGIIFTFVPVMGDSIVPTLLGGGKQEFLADTVMSLSTAMNYSGAAAFATIMLALTGLLALVFVLFRRRAGVDFMSALALDFAHRAARREARLIGFAIGITLIAGFGITALIYAPVIYLGLLSISGDPLAGLPGAFTFKWYGDLFAETGWVKPLALSLEIAVIVAVLCMASAMLVGRMLPRLKRGQALLMAAFLLPLVVPGMVVGIDLFAFYKMLLTIKMGFWSLILVHFIWAFPFALIGMLVVSSRFDVRLLEAASDLGASSWRRFWDIERPLLMSGVMTAGMFGFLLSLTELPRSIFVAGRTQTLPLFTWAETMSHGSHVSLIYCLNTLIAVVSVALSVLSVWMLGRRVKS